MSLKFLDKRLFLRYAIPCLEVKVERGEMSEEEFKEIVKKFTEGRILSDEEIAKLFPVAIFYIKKMVEKGRDEVIIDKKVIDRYFLDEHVKVLEKYPQKNRERCYVLPGRVIEVIGDEAVVETPFGRKKISLKLIKDEMKNQDLIGKCLAVHYSFACVVLDKKECKKLWERYEKIKTLSW